MGAFLLKIPIFILGKQRIIMAYVLSRQNRALVNQINALQTSQEILRQPASIAVLNGTKEIVNGQSAPPRNIGEAIQFYTDAIFGKGKDPFYYKSQYGIPIYNYLLIKGEESTLKERYSKQDTLSSYRTKYTNNGQPNPNTWDELTVDGKNTEEASFPAVFMDSAIISVSKKKNIVKTKIVNNSSTRKEYISSGDYDISISGVFTTNSDRIYPISDVDALIRACEAPIPLSVVSPYLFYFGITNMVVESFTLPQEKGSYATQRFSIKAVSHAASYAEIGSTLLNDTQAKSKTQSTLDDIQNLRSSLDADLEEFFATNALLSKPL